MAATNKDIKAPFFELLLLLLCSKKVKKLSPGLKPFTVLRKNYKTN